MNRLKKVLCYTLIFLILAGAAYYSKSIIDGSKNVDMSEPVIQRASSELDVIAAENHAVTNTENIAKVRNYITQQLDSMGVDYVQYTTVYDTKKALEEKVDTYNKADAKKKAAFMAIAKKAGYDNYRDYAIYEMKYYYDLDYGTSYPITSYFVKMENPFADQGILLVSHYDNAWLGNGAADDGTAVAGMLEAIRTATQINMSNSMYFLFTDAEEIGLEGCRYFLENAVDYKDKIAAVYNFEARGVSGASILFQTSENNAALIKETAKAMSYMTGYSIEANIYKYMQNDTDLTLFLYTECQGLNFAFADGEEGYHMEYDNTDMLADNSFYETVTAQQDLVKYFANSDLSKLVGDSDTVFFSLFKGSLVMLDGRLTRVLSVLAAIFSMVVMVMYALEKKISLKKILLTLGILVAVVIGVFAVITAVGYPISSEYAAVYKKCFSGKGDPARLWKLGKDFDILFYSQLIITALIALAATKLFGNKRKIKNEFNVICLLINGLATLLFAIFLKDGAYIMAVPTLLFAGFMMAEGRENKITAYILRYPFISVLMAVTIGFLGIPLLLLLYGSLLSAYVIVCDGALCALILLPIIEIFQCMPEKQIPELTEEDLY